MSRNILRIPSFATRGLLDHRPERRLPTLQIVRFFDTAPTLEFVPRRAMMYVPGSEERKLLKIPSLGCDCAVMDMEDGVAQNRKEEARANIFNALSTLDFSNTADVAVRINSVSSGLAEADLLALSEAENLPMTLMLPKVDSCEEVLWFATTLNKIFKNENLQRPFRLVIFTESADGLLDLREILLRLRKLSCVSDPQGAAYVVEGVVFGSDDFCASIGATRTAEGKELLYARQKIVTIAKGFQLQAIDMVHIDYKDLEGLRVQSEFGAGMGFTGKQVIHPGQVQVVQESFTPSEAKRMWALDLIQAFEEHQESGKGAFVFRDKMIDMPLLRQAKNIVDLCKNMKLPS